MAGEIFIRNNVTLLDKVSSMFLRFNNRCTTKDNTMKHTQKKKRYTKVISVTSGNVIIMSENTELGTVSKVSVFFVNCNSLQIDVGGWVRQTKKLQIEKKAD